MYGRHLTLTETFYPAQDTVNKFESGYYSLNYRVGPASGYIFAVTIRGLSKLYSCTQNCNENRFIPHVFHVI